MTATHDEMIAELRLANASLQQRLDAALVRHETDYDERAAHQAATIDVLKAMAASPGDPQPVFELICRQARTLLDVQAIGLLEYDGQLIHLRAEVGVLAMIGPEAYQTYLNEWPRLPDRGSMSGRAIVDGTIVHVRDVASDPESSHVMRALGHKTSVAVPFVLGGRAIGAITTASTRVDAVSDSQIELLKTFAKQAVIAIGGAKTYRALQESLEYQTATGDVLKVISRSTFDLDLVLRTVAEVAARLCDADQAHSSRYEGGLLQLVANVGYPPEYEAAVKARGAFALDPNSQTVATRAVLDRRLVHIADVAAVPGYGEVAINLGKQRTSLGVPLLRDGEAIGVITLARQRVEPFTERQIELVSTFADQAVIAIENTRLLTEQREALEQQTATAEVLQVINASPGDLTPVFEAIVEKAHALCSAAYGSLQLWDGELFRGVAMRGFSEPMVEVLRLGYSPWPNMPCLRLIEGEPIAHCHDLAEVDDPTARLGVALSGLRTVLYVALRKDDVLLGQIVAARREVRPFTDKEIALVESFAAQAVIAMENARLINEQREALEQQTAVADVLQVINASPGNLAPVFEAMLEKAMRLCRVAFGELWDVEKPARPVAMLGVPPAYAAFREQTIQMPEPGTFGAHMAAGERVIHVLDLTETDAYRDGQPGRRAMVDLGGARSALGISMLKDNQPRGAIIVYRNEVRAFSDKEIALLENFAAQAVIAMDNARLLTEQQEALEQQTATAEVLQVINESPGNLTPVFDIILEKAVSLCDSRFGFFSTYDGQLMHLVAARGLEPGREALFPDRPPAPGQPTGRIAAGEDVVHLLDARDQDGYRAGFGPTVNFVDQVGARSVLWIALRKDATLLGMMALFRREVRAFSDKEIALVKNFAAQAVIAMENARLLGELRERTTDLQRSVEYQAATIDVLKVMSSSSSDTQPVFDIILRSAMHLCDCVMGGIWEFDGELVHLRAIRGHDHDSLAFFTGQYPRAPTPATLGERSILESRVVHLRDYLAESGLAPEARALAHRSVLAVPLLRDGAAIGSISLGSPHVDGFSDAHIELLKTFAEQAVIAIGSTTTFRALQTRTSDLQESLEYQTATSDVLKVINASPGDLAPVFNSMLEKAMRLCGAAFGGLSTWDGGDWRLVAALGYPEPFVKYMTTRNPASPPPPMILRLIETKRALQIPDLMSSEGYKTGHPDTRALVTLGGARTGLLVPLIKDAVVVGNFTIYRQDVRPFSDKEITLLENFASQAVIAIENTRLLNEQREALEQQTATAEVLQVINANPGNLTPVFDAILDKAIHVSESDLGTMHVFEDGAFRTLATRNVPPRWEEFLRAPMRPTPGIALERLVNGEDVVHVSDVLATPLYESAPLRRAFADLSGARTAVWVALRRDDQLLGVFIVYRQEVRPFSDKQITLLQNFAAQAVIAMESARLLNELRARTDELARRQAELRITFENMGDGVAMFDGTPRLVAWNSKFQEIFDVPDTLLEQHQTYEDYIRYLGARGDFGPNVDVEEQIRRFNETAGEYHAYERIRPDGRVIEIRHNPVAGGGFVLIFSDITERKCNEAEIAAARDAAQEATRTIEAAFRELKTAQANLIQAEKMASLGQLTAGIAHEIKNPLNFVNNFAILSVELLGELKETIAKSVASLDDDQRAEIEEVSAMLTSNLEKITEHGKRADGIVKSMLEHSRGASGERRTVDINALAEEALNLAYHGARAQDQSFNVTLERDFGPAMAPIELNPQDITRVLLNLFGNGFYAAKKRGVDPTLKVSTRDAGDAVEIRVRDNGTGIPDDIRDKLFQPFFTTKPTGEGTGLGLSITYDIVTKQHGGSIAVDSVVDEFSEFVVTLPRHMTGEGAGFH